jgi:hypothetical protein
MTDLAAITTRLDQLAPRAADAPTLEEVFSLMERAAASPAGLDTLVARYAARSEPLLLRPLTFLVARAISAQGPAAGAAPTLQLVERLRCDDESVRINLASALHLLAMHRALPEHPPARMAAFLIESLHGGPAPRDAAVPAVAAALAAGVHFTDGELSRLRTALKALRDEDPEWAAAALKMIRDRAEPGFQP